MHRDPCRLLLVACLFACPAMVVAQPAPPPLPPANQGAVLKDRIVAVVDEDPILASEVDRAIILGLRQMNPGESDAAFRRRVLNELIADRLRLHEIDRFGLAQVPGGEIGKGVDEIAAQQELAAHARDLKGVGGALDVSRFGSKVQKVVGRAKLSRPTVTPGRPGSLKISPTRPWNGNVNGSGFRES